METAARAGRDRRRDDIPQSNPKVTVALLPGRRTIWLLKKLFVFHAFFLLKVAFN